MAIYVYFFIKRQTYKLYLVILGIVVETMELRLLVVGITEKYLNLLYKYCCTYY